MSKDSSTARGDATRDRVGYALIIVDDNERMVFIEGMACEFQFGSRGRGSIQK